MAVSAGKIAPPSLTQRCVRPEGGDVYSNIGIDLLFPQSQNKIFYDLGGIVDR